MNIHAYLYNQKSKFYTIFQELKRTGLYNYLCSRIDFLLRLPVSLAQPSRVRIEIISGTCNLSCKMCSLPPGKNLKKEISFEEFKKIFDACNHGNYLHLSGYGEPFLVKDIFKIIEYAKRSGCLIGVITNMTLIDETVARKLVDAQLDFLGISFDGATKETFEDIRTGARFETIIDNIKTLNRIKKERGSKKPVISLSVTTMKKNIDEIPLIIELAKNLEISRVKINSLKVNDKAPLAAETQALWHAPEQTQKSIALARQKAKNLGINLRVTLSYPNNDCNAFESIPGLKGCKQPWQLLEISMDGSIRPCCRSVTKIGNILDGGMARVWNNKRFRMIRKIVRKEGKSCYTCSKTLNNFDERSDMR